MTVLGTAKPSVLGTKKPLVLGTRKPQLSDGGDPLRQAQMNSKSRWIEILETSSDL